jgi:ribonuclease P protein component
VHLLAGSAADPALPARAGLVVSKSVGGSVVRTRLARRLRHQLRPLLPQLPAGTCLVVRAAPAAASAPSAALAEGLHAAVDRLVPR